MDLSKKLSIFSIAVAIISVIVSFVVVPKINIKDEPQSSDDITSILNENQAQIELDARKTELLQNLNFDFQSQFYVDFCDTAETVNDAVAAKKEELRKCVQDLLDKAAACRDDVEKMCNSKGIAVGKRLEALKNYENSEGMKALNELVVQAEQIKTSIETDIQVFKEAEAQQKAAEQQRTAERQRADSPNSVKPSGGRRPSSGNRSGDRAASGGGTSTGGRSQAGDSSSAGDGAQIGGSNSAGNGSTSGGGSFPRGSSSVGGASSAGGGSSTGNASSNNSWGGSER